MKRDGFARISFFALAALAAACARGAEISESQAVQAARGWMSLELMLQDKFSAEPESVKRYEGEGGKGAFYVVSLRGGGVVVTSGDTALSPVVAYSADGIWEDDPAKNPLLAILPSDIAAATAAAEAAGDGQGATGRAGAGAATANKKAAQWAALLAAGAGNGQDARSTQRAGAGAASLKNVEPSDLRVGMLLKTKWDQGDNKWNLYTPLNRVCGCTATAAGQVMAYFRWPKGTVTPAKTYAKANGVGGIGGWHVEYGYQASAAQAEAGEYTPWAVPFGGEYDDTFWADVANGVPSAMSRLVRDIGVASYMSYDADGSAATVSNVHPAFLDTFRYASARSCGWMAESVWKTTILSNLDAKRPVWVEIPGHAIVADGYGYQDGTLYVHFNMGWEGYYNYWYQPPDLTETYSVFTRIGPLIYNIYPQKIYENETANLTIVSGRLFASDGTTLLAGRTVSAKREGKTFTATTDENGIYALYLPGGDSNVYDISAVEDGAIATATLTVKECTGSTPNNVHGLELTTNRVQTPAITPADGSDFSEGTQLTVEFACATPGATIRYTLDGTEPTEESAQGASVVLSGTATVKAKAFKDGLAASATASATFTARPAAQQPTLTPPAGTTQTQYGPRRRVTMTSPVAGATIRYTLDGTEPTEESAVYTEPLMVEVPATVKAKAWADGCWPGGSQTATVVLEKMQYSGGRWIDESETTREATGTWAQYVEYEDGKLSIDGSNTYTPAAQSRKIATIESEMTFGERSELDGEYLDDAKAAIRIGTGGSFEVLAAGANGEREWIAATAEGVSPDPAATYRVRFVLNCRTCTYTAAICRSGDGAEGEPVALVAAGGRTSFGFAGGNGTGRVKALRCEGEGTVAYIHGDTRGSNGQRAGVVISVK